MIPLTTVFIVVPYSENVRIKQKTTVLFLSTLSWLIEKTAREKDTNVGALADFTPTKPET